MKIGHGYLFTNSYGEYTLPWLADEETLSITNILRKPITLQDSACDGCHNIYYNNFGQDSILFECTFPCVLRSTPFKQRRPVRYFPAMYQDSSQLVYCDKVICKAAFHLCLNCKTRSESIIRVSDHIAYGADWIDLADKLHCQVTNKAAWTLWSGGEEIATRHDAKIMCLLDKAINSNGQIGHFSKLPSDILFVLAPLIKGTGLLRFATKIQSLWRGYRIRAYKENKKWHLLSGKSIYESQWHNMWAVCDDCGMKRRTHDMVVCDACADRNTGCCKKVICRQACCYNCPDCGKTNFVKFDDKHMDGGPTYFDCLCGTSFLLTE